MSTSIDLIKAEKMIWAIESYVKGCMWHSGKNCESILKMQEVDMILNRVEKALPPPFPELYVQQVEKASNLRDRWRVAKGLWPVNPHNGFGGNPTQN
jgi:hypothetical protein